SNYLAPQLGALSPDTWVIFTIWLRNTVLNQIILLLVLSASSLQPLVLGNLAIQLRYLSGGFYPWLIAVGLPVAVLLVLVVIRMSTNVTRVIKREFPPFAPDDAPDDDQSSWFRLVLPLFAGSVLLSFLIACGRFDPVHQSKSTGLFMAVALFTLFYVSLRDGGFPQCYKLRHPQSREAQSFFIGILFVAACTAVTWLLLAGVGHYLPPGGGGLSV